LKIYPAFKMTRRGFLGYALGVGAVILGPVVACAQEKQKEAAGTAGTTGMKRRQDRRDDRGERVQTRDENRVERRDDPIGVRGPERREDRRDLKNDRRSDRRERVL
jgi:hypothetical protein